MPSYLRDHGLAPSVATTALALIGLFNVFGTYVAGSLGGRLLEAGAAVGRSTCCARWSSPSSSCAPLTPWSVYLFAATMGFLWLSTVPPTNGVVAHIFGVRFLSMLGGFVFLSHQIGSFLGVWLGGRLYDTTGSYDIVWWIAVALGIVAALINLPIREQPVVRPAARMKRRIAVGLAWLAVAAALARGVRRLSAAGAGGRPREPALELLLVRRPRGPRTVALGPRAGRISCPAAARVLDVAAGRGRHVRWFAGRGHPVTAVDRDAAALAALPASIARSSSPTSKAALGRCRAGPSTRWSSRTTSGGRCFADLVAAARRRRRAALRDLRRRQRDGRQAVEPGLPAAPGRTSGRSRRVCASSPTKTASSTTRRASCSALPPCAKPATAAGRARHRLLGPGRHAPGR